jgi:WD40 repeat protein
MHNGLKVIPVLLFIMMVLVGCTKSQPLMDLPPTTTEDIVASSTVPVPSVTFTPLPTFTPSPPPPTPTINIPIVINPLDLQLISANTASRVSRLNLISGHDDRVWTLEFSFDSRYLASASWDRTVKLWDIWNGQEVHTFSMGRAELNALTFSPVENWLAIANVIWDADSLQQVRKIGPSSNEPIHAAFSPDGLYLALTVFNQPVRMVQAASGEKILDFSDLQATPIFGIEFSPDGSLLAVAKSGGTVQLYDTASGELINTLEYGGENSDVHDLAFSPDGHYLVTAGTYPSALIWDLASGEVVHRLSHGDGMYGVAFSPDGSLVATAVCDRTVRLWDAATGKLLNTLNHRDEVATVAFSPDGHLLASAGYDSFIYIWGVRK